jgi:hypothetical protein
MAFRVKDVLIVNATIIIGLLILLTFQSISSSFIESEVSTYNKKWRDAIDGMNITNDFLADCKFLVDDRKEFEKMFLEYHSLENEDGTITRIIDSFTMEMEAEMKQKCTEYAIKSLEDYWNLIEIETTGFYLNYLSQYDEDGNELSAIDGFEYDETLWYSTNESGYFDKIVTGPLYVNIANVLMIIPFTVSAVIASFNAFSKNEEINKASRISVISMGVGFTIMIGGFIAILFAIYEVYIPFI